VQPLTVYLEKIPTGDKLARKNDYSIIVWADQEKTERKAIIPWYHSNKPDKRNKYLMINCYRWRIEWL
jgi:hypothetical protein